MTLKEYFECHFGQAKPPGKITKSKKESVPAKQKQITKGAVGGTKGAVGGMSIQTSSDTRKVDKSSVKTDKPNQRKIGNGSPVTISFKKGAKGKRVDKADKDEREEDAKVGSNLSVQELVESENEYYVDKFPVFDIQAMADVELVDLAQGVVFKKENLLPVFTVEFFRPEE